MKITCNKCNDTLNTEELKQGIMYHCSCNTVSIDILSNDRVRILAESDKDFTLDKCYTINGELHERKDDTRNNIPAKTKSTNRRHDSNRNVNEDTKR